MKTVYLSKTPSTRPKALLFSLLLFAAGGAGAATVNVPMNGLTGVWRFENADGLGNSTLGYDIRYVSNGVYAAYTTRGGGPWSEAGIESWLSKFSDGYWSQESSWNYLEVNPGFTANGGGIYVNEYTVAIDYFQTMDGMNSIFQTAWTGTENDGDLWIDGTVRSAATIGVDDVGFSTLTFDAAKPHRIVWTVNSGNFFRVYVDGTNYLEGAGQTVDGRFSLYPDRFNLFADNDWHDLWGYVGTVATWNRALTPEEVQGLGGWITNSVSPTHLVFPDEPPTVVSVSPADGETNVSPLVSYRAEVRDLLGLVDTNSYQLLLDGVPVVATVTTRPAMQIVTYASSVVLEGGSTHTFTLTATASGVSATNKVTFTVQDYHSYEWRFSNGDLSAAVGTGVLSYADPTTTPALTTFGTSDGTTVPHINGTPAKYMYVPAFTLNTDGYLLEFTESAPNVTGGDYINQYTVLMDVLVPGPLNWTPFFNTDPFNLNDADFYLADDGSIGIGSGYSAAGTIAPGVWYRVAFVADLQANTLTYYVNGTNVKSRAGDGLDGRWALYSNQDLGADMLLFSEPTGQYTHELYVSSVAFSDRVLTPAEIAALGGPNENGIFVPGPVVQPSLTIAPTTGGVLISWPQSYAGYELQQTDSLSAPVWQAVPGVINNSVTVPTSGTAKFFRLMK